MANAEFYQAFDFLLGIGLVRPSGRFNEHGEILYECVPDAERSDEAKEYAAYLDSLGNPTRVN